MWPCDLNLGVVVKEMWAMIRIEKGADRNSRKLELYISVRKNEFDQIVNENHKKSNMELSDQTRRFKMDSQNRMPANVSLIREFILD